jgi:diguanylate cyclase (GGDEF)-like protein
MEIISSVIGSVPPAPDKPAARCRYTRNPVSRESPRQYGSSGDPMISIKRYLDSDSPVSGKSDEASQQDSFAAALDAYGSALLEMGNCSLDACPGLGDALKQSLERLKAELSPAMKRDKLAAHGDQTRDLLRAWGRDAARHYQGKAREVKEMLLTMARAAESVSARDQRSAGQMSAVTERLRAIATLDDLTEIRASIDKSAVELKSSIDRMTEEGKAVLNQLKKQVVDYQAKLEQAEMVASRDALTGVSSRAYVEGQIEKRIASGVTFCVVIVDIDDFKKVNDAHGHQTGDGVLKQFADELRSACGRTDTIGRWGGDEFILLFDCGLEEAEGKTARLRERVCGNYSVLGKAGTLKLRVDASIGLAAHAAGEGMTDVVGRADAAMYEQKTRG